MTEDALSSNVTDAELLAYIEGETDAELVELIEGSETLLQRVRQLKRETGWLLAHLFRHTCPSTDELGDFYLNVLPEAKARSIERHLAHCPHCSYELVQYEGFLGEQPAQPGLTRRIVVSLAKLLDKATLPERGLVPAYSLRGENQVTLYQAEGLQISLDVQADVERPDAKSIVGIIVGPHADTFTLDLWREGKHLDTAYTGEAGSFSLPDLLPGTYELVIKGADVIVHIQSFSL